MNWAVFILICDCISLAGNYRLFQIMRQWGAQPTEPQWVYYNATACEREANDKRITT